MLVSIIIPIYNVENYIEECLESVYQQIYPHIEVILVNDRTPDHSMEIANTIVAKYQDKFPTTIINHEQNKGLSEARNSGMKIAKGEYIYFIDSDDRITHNAIELLANVVFQHKDIEIVEGEYTRESETNSKTLVCKKPTFDIYEGNESRNFFLSSHYVWNTLFKSSFIQQHSIHFISGILYEDVPFRCSIDKHLSKMGKLQDITYFYRNNKESICNKLTPKHFESRIQVLQIIENQISASKTNQTALNNLFCTYSFIFWSHPWRKQPYYHTYLPLFKSTIKYFLRKHYNKTKLYNLLLLSPALFPYSITKYYVKLIWRIRTLKANTF